MLRTSEATVKRLRALRLDAINSVNIPVPIVDDIVHDLIEAHRRDRELAEACERLERRPITLARRSA